MSNKIKGYALRNSRPLHNGRRQRSAYDSEPTGCVIAFVVFATLVFGACCCI